MTVAFDLNHFVVEGSRTALTYSYNLSDMHESTVARVAPDVPVVVVVIVPVGIAVIVVVFVVIVPVVVAVIAPVVVVVIVPVVVAVIAPVVEGSVVFSSCLAFHSS